MERKLESAQQELEAERMRRAAAEQLKGEALSALHAAQALASSEADDAQVRAHAHVDRSWARSGCVHQLLLVL